MKEEFNEFEDKTDNFKDKSKEKKDFHKKSGPDFNSEEKIRVKLPRANQVIGIIEQRLGGNKMRVSCTDGKSRMGRVPGRLRRRLWLRPEDVIIVEPWELDDSKADVLFKYTPAQKAWLRKKGFLEKAEIEF
ncbi:translation initiation factor eIF-1A [Candidatus Pacearchaeota archaeon]|nr:translation initiation factor eIF-1A [Candidatus Pacearchaeota archaeon]